MIPVLGRHRNSVVWYYNDDDPFQGNGVSSMNRSMHVSCIGTSMRPCVCVMWYSYSITLYLLFFSLLANSGSFHCLGIISLGLFFLATVPVAIVATLQLKLVQIGLQLVTLQECKGLVGSHNND